MDEPIPLISDHVAFLPLLPVYKQVIRKMLAAYNAAPNQEAEHVQLNNPENYAYKLFARADEIDKGFSSIKLVEKQLENLQLSEESARELLIYHYENFLIRAVGMVDRAHKLAGQAILIPTNILESTGCNRVVNQKSERLYGTVHSALAAVVESVTDYKSLRNELVHSQQFSNRLLSSAAMVQTFGDQGDLALSREALALFRRNALAEVRQTWEGLQKSLNELLSALAPIVTEAFILASDSKHPSA
ncbi:hypothetical protein [Pandoraea fibrosis]|uniref:Uncharacterized protein n=1 Tax=Pandoraea fibrosis TaxID=1891094 RepID=A0A5E4SVM6_9BURK|nr:hypothetical protein [Pandoraea fibrosis]VVD78813.1 hypothetical protein PFI31113_00999 [Pandoraea fibrosis]